MDSVYNIDSLSACSSPFSTDRETIFSQTHMHTIPFSLKKMMKKKRKWGLK